MTAAFALLWLAVAGVSAVLSITAVEQWARVLAVAGLALAGLGCVLTLAGVIEVPR